MRKIIKAFKEISTRSKAILVIFGISIFGSLGFLVTPNFVIWVWATIMIIGILYQVAKAFDEFYQKWRA